MKFDPIAYARNYDRTNYDHVNLRLPKGVRAELAREAKERNMSLNKYLHMLIAYGRAATK